MQAQVKSKKAQTASKKPQAIYGKARTGSKLAQAISKKSQAVSFDTEKLRKEILREARAVSGIAVMAGTREAAAKMKKTEEIDWEPKAAEKYAEKVAKKVGKWADKREKITKNDLNEKIAKEIEKYNKDLAFIYKNRGKII